MRACRRCGDRLSDPGGNARWLVNGGGRLRRRHGGMRMAGSLGRLFAELRRRRVVRVLVVYAVAGWLVIQVAATMLPSLHLPEWSVTLVIALVGLGLPITIAMAWMFDAGP